MSQNLDVLALTEMWLCNGDNIILNELLPPDYDIRHVDKGEIISYSSDFITSFKTNVNTISKKVCKQIFAHKIWNILNVNGLIRHVKSSTHQKGHILDLVITREQSNLLKRPPVVFISGVSDVNSSSSLDHFAVLCYLNVNDLKQLINL